MLRQISNNNRVGITDVNPVEVLHDVGMDQEVGPQLLLPDDQHHGHGGREDVLQLQLKSQPRQLCVEAGSSAGTLIGDELDSDTRLSQPRTTTTSDLTLLTVFVIVPEDCLRTALYGHPISLG